MNLVNPLLLRQMDSARLFAQRGEIMVIKITISELSPESQNQFFELLSKLLFFSVFKNYKIERE